MIHSVETPRVLVCDSLPEDALKPLIANGFRVDFIPKLPQDEIAGVIGKYAAVIVRSAKRISARELANPGGLQVIARAGVGVDNIDVEEATKKGILVINTPEGNTVSAAELTIGHMIALVRHIPEADQSIREGRWDRNKLGGMELRGKTLGILGLGNIGSAVAQRAIGFEMNIIGFDPLISEERAEQIGVKLVSFEDILRGSDIITLHVPLVAATRRFINAETLKWVKNGARLINVARGELVDEEALVVALDEGRLSGAALDVFPDEPKVSESIRQHPKVILTPHLGASTEEAQGRVADEAVRGVIEVLSGRMPRSGVVNLRIASEVLGQLEPFIAVTENLAIMALRLSEGQRIKGVEAHFLGDISECTDLRPLRAALIRGLVSSFSDQVVNLVNYRAVEEQIGLRVNEHRGNKNGVYPSSIKISLIHENGATSVSGVDAHGPKTIEINGYPVESPIGGKKLLICQNKNRPGMVGKVATALGKYHVNIDALNVGTHPLGESAMMVYVLDAELTRTQISAIKSIDGIQTAVQLC